MGVLEVTLLCFWFWLVVTAPMLPLLLLLSSVDGPPLQLATLKVSLRKRT